ncbi:MAG: rod-binding protein [Acetivibrio sp.]
MSISLDGTSLYNNYTSGTVHTSDKTNSLEQSLSNMEKGKATDQELLEACKSFETYFTEQVFKEMKKTVHSSDDDGEYMQCFGDMLGEEYAKNITDSGSLGIAQMLYESMKNNR